MGFIKWLEDKFTGDLIAEYGALSSDAQGLAVSASLRQRRNGKHYLVLKWEGKSTLQWVDLEASRTMLDRLTDIIADARTRVPK